MTLRRNLMLTVMVVGQLGLAPASSADWTVYLGGELGIASGTVTGQGTSNITTPARPVGASYTDSSPLIGGSLGISSPMNEVTPWALPYDLRLPAWPVSLEVEATGLRSFEGIELVPGTNRRSAGSTEAWSVMFNLWQDVPLDPLNRGLSKLFGRLPRFVIDTLNRTSLRAGAGVGVTGLEYLFIDEEHVAGSETTNFSWQAGTSLGYAITKVVRLDLGYRYFDYGGDESPVFDRIDVQGLYELEQASHEFRARMTVDVYSFRAPWRF